MSKSVFFRRILTLLGIALLISSIISVVSYSYVMQHVYVQMHASELLPAAQSIAQLVAENLENETEPYNLRAILSGKGFLGAHLHLYDLQQNQISQEGNGRAPEPKDGARYGEPSIAQAAPPAIPGEPGRPDASDNSSPEDLSSIIRPFLPSILSGQEITSVNNKKGYLIVGVPVKGSAGQVMGALVFTRRVSELNDSLDGLKITLILSTLVTFLLMLGPVFYAARKVTVPILEMRDISLLMAKGDFSRQADESQKGEIGQLAASINRFAGETQRLEKTRQDYVANVSHELRTPISAIRAMSETLSDGIIHDENKKHQYYRRIMRESMRLSRLVSDLLELSRLQSGAIALRKGLFPIEDALCHCGELYTEMAREAGIGFQVIMPPGPLPMVYSNADRVEQVLSALLDNAIKHTPEDGSIAIAAQDLPDYVEITVSDTGDGIPPEDLPHVFERFYKVDKSHSTGGTGLGLSIASELLALLGETIRVQSGTGKGSAFTFTVHKA